MNRLLNRGEPWDGLTDIGKRIVTRVRRIRRRPFWFSRAVLGLKVSPNYFDLEVTDEKAWRRVLPEVVRIIRQETGDPKATVKVYNWPSKNSPTVEQWHAPLLKELFG